MRRPKFPARSVVTKTITLLCLWATYTAVGVLVAAVVACDVLEPDVPDTATPTTAFIQPTAVQQVPAAVATVSAPQMPFSSQTATPTPIPTPTVPSTPTPVPIREVNFTGIVTSTNLPSQVQVVFSLRDQEGHAIVLPAEQVKRGLQVSERGPGTDGAWEEIDYTETSFFVHTAENIDLEVVFVLDFTNSMSEARLSDGSSGVDAMLRAFEAALAVLPSAHRVGVVEFHDRNVSPSVLSRLTTNRQAILDSVGDFDSGSSRVWDSVVTGSNLFSSREQNPRAVRALVFLSDGRDTSSDSMREQAAQYARERGVQLYAVSVGDVFQESELRSVAHSTDGAYYSAHDLDLVQEQLHLLVNDLRGQYQLTYITLRRSGGYHIGISARLVGIRGETEVGPFDVARFFASDNQGVIGYDPPSLDRASQRATVFMRAQHIPRNIDRIRFRADTDKPLRVELVPSRDGGLLEGWTLNGPDSGGWYEAESATPLEFGSLGLLAKLTISGVTEEGSLIPIEFDNSIYTGGKALARSSHILTGDLRPSGRIAFSSTRSGSDDYEIRVINLDGLDTARVSDHIAQGNHPAWSPDGLRIAFDRRIDDAIVIKIMDVDSGLVTEITDTPNWDPAGSSNGQQIAFVSSRDGNREIYVKNSRGSGIVRLTNNNYIDSVPDWSPDGDKIAFASNRDGDYEIYIMKADGSGIVRLTNDDCSDLNPAWSPDGERIAFYSDRDRNRELYVMNADSSNVTRLTNRPDHQDWDRSGRRTAGG